MAFLQFCSHGELKDLADILMFDKGSRRLTEQLSAEPRFTGSREDLTKVWDMLAAEVQRFGGDTVVNQFRGGKGVLYTEILGDICKLLKLPFVAGNDAAATEDRIILAVLKRGLDQMSDAERAEFAKKIGSEFGDGSFDPSKASAAAIMALLQAAVAMGGFASFQVAVIVANAVTRFAVGRGLTLAGNAGLAQLVAAFAGPVGWAISGALAIPAVSGPATRVTLPAVLYIAYLRKKKLGEDQL